MRVTPARARLLFYTVDRFLVEGAKLLTMGLTNLTTIFSCFVADS